MYVTKRSMANAVSSMTKHLEQVSSALAVSFFLYPFIMLSQAWHSISYELLRYWNIWKISGYHGEAWPRAMEMLYSRQRLFLFRESVVFQLQTWCITNLSYFDRFNWIILCIVDNCHIAIVSIMYRYFFILLFFLPGNKAPFDTENWKSGRKSWWAEWKFEGNKKRGMFMSIQTLLVFKRLELLWYNLLTCCNVHSLAVFTCSLFFYLLCGHPFHIVVFCLLDEFHFFLVEIFFIAIHNNCCFVTRWLMLMGKLEELEMMWKQLNCFFQLWWEMSIFLMFLGLILYH